MQVINYSNNCLTKEIKANSAVHIASNDASLAKTDDMVSKSFDTFEYKNTAANNITYSPSTLSSKTLATRL